VLLTFNKIFFVLAGSLVEDPAMDCLISLIINRAQDTLCERPCGDFKCSITYLMAKVEIKF